MLLGVVAALSVLVVSSAAFAQEAQPIDWAETFSGIASDLVATIGAVLPVGLTVAAAFLGIRYAIRTFKGVAR